LVKIKEHARQTLCEAVSGDQVHDSKRLEKDEGPPGRFNIGIRPIEPVSPAPEHGFPDLVGALYDTSRGHSQLNYITDFLTKVQTKEQEARSRRNSVSPSRGADKMPNDTQ
jgi:hypothetical protein